MQIVQKKSLSRYWVLASVCMAGLILPLEYTGPAMALPAIQNELGGSGIALSWVINAFALSFGSAVMAAGALADQYGRKKMFVIGITGFTLFSIIVSVASNVIFLDLVRGLQGFFAALTMAGGNASLAQEFDGRARTKAFGLLGTAFGAGLAFGPVISGILIEIFGWRSVFLLGAVFGAIALIIGGFHMRESRDPDAGRLDIKGLVSFTSFLVLLTFGIMQIPQSGISSLTVILLLSASVTMLAIFIACELTHARPMLDISLFRIKRFVGVQFLPLATAICFIVLLILLPLRLIGIEGYNAIQAGEMIIALSAPMLFVPFLAALLTRWISPPVLSCMGLLCATIGLTWLANMAVGSEPTMWIFPLLLIGIGTGFPWGLMDDLSIRVVPIERAGMATGIFTTMRACGEAISVAGSLAMLNSLLHVGLRQASLQPSNNVISAAANNLTTGNFEHAKGLFAHLSEQDLMAIYSDAFSLLLYALVGITLLAAVICFLALRDDRIDIRSN
ncbi:tetracenomycin C efflux protein [Xenorhabdus mauleonii]|uniref:Major Facilitator Superfamily protein n=1 Tax=Xenorhabdus mauleonii TaxID=351675 RepID=A0A1I3L331_9GAMM|nr:MFS transporter [Xenorhabdus mauleonii]PHM44534.1 tetracenomycin C efflux protein [Xenorhabdus mauleonii]SFI79111.1 Major Facilitator Superfamily protein [Xenorhabdus mauleonii]